MQLAIHYLLTRVSICILYTFVPRSNSQWLSVPLYAYPHRNQLLALGHIHYPINQWQLLTLMQVPISTFLSQNVASHYCPAQEIGGHITCNLWSAESPPLDFCGNVQFASLQTMQSTCVVLHIVVCVSGDRWSPRVPLELPRISSEDYSDQSNACSRNSCDMNIYSSVTSGIIVAARTPLSRTTTIPSLCMH